jgi:hypothetical protein
VIGLIFVVIGDGAGTKGSEGTGRGLGEREKILRFSRTESWRDVELEAERVGMGFKLYCWHWHWVGVEATRPPVDPDLLRCCCKKGWNENYLWLSTRTDSRHPTRDFYIEGGKSLVTPASADPLVFQNINLVLYFSNINLKKTFKKLFFSGKTEKINYFYHLQSC